MSGEGRVVCVTGASGFVASCLVKLLLARGYSVHATVQSLDDPKLTDHLRALDGAKERLSLFEVNLLEEGSFDSAVNGCECVFHTGSPVLVSASDPQVEVIDPAVKGTLNILKSASKVPSLKRVVLTLSIAAVVFTKKPLESGITVDETWFSEPIICEQNKNWYALSKTLAEDAAIKFSKENGLELIGIHPGYVIGPFLQPTPNLAAEGIMRLIKSGKDVFPDGLYRLVDVRDVATAHILAFENPEANGRYLMVGYTVRSFEIVKIIDKLYPNLGNFERSEDSKCNEPLPYNISKTRAEGLGVDFTSLEITIKDTSLLMNGEGKVVCVTGASGYIASWLVKCLLESGYLVHATVRSLDDPKRSEHLLGLDGAKERLSLFEANLMEEGSFDSAVNGCECVFHTASPVLISVTDPQAQLLDPAVKGTLNVLKSAAKVPSLKRVVLTSSIAAVMFGKEPLESGVMVDETWFSDPEICAQKKLWYPLAKTLAEDAAVKFSKENGLELVALHPGYVIGPFFQPNINVASEGILNLIKTEKDLFPDGIYRLVDVRDVATAHILAFENPDAHGRYCIVGNMTRSSEILKIVGKLYPALINSQKYEDDKCVDPLPYNVSREKAESLGVKFTPVEVSIKDTIESLKEKNQLSF
uniref:uncharacterized protein LOC122598613 n=1 Tax=Erigeron canadensis TaxID=72917 RepID=UPI001CB9A561|nr:uncharacterized protein LOC122598613 [Erigeron canadensis]